MNNDRKQKVISILDSLTDQELENYISTKSFVKTQVNKEAKHIDRIIQKIEEDSCQVSARTYKLGEARIIASILEWFCNDKYGIEDLQYYLKTLMEEDLELKEYVYEIMKDFYD